MKAAMYYMQQNDLKDEKWEPTNVSGYEIFFLENYSISSAY